MINLKQFEHELPFKVKELIQLINKQGFKVGIIGGAVRSFIMQGSVLDDIDCEIRPIDEDDFEKWPSIYEKIKNNYKGTELLPFNVLRVPIGDDLIELSLPRVEHIDGSQGHSNFKAEFIPDVDYSQGFYRRDLTINSMMAEYDGKEWKFIDPFNGVKDLEDKVIRHATSHFSLDPVRFLRALRFAIRYKFSLAEKTQTLLETMNLEGLSPYYLKYEVVKSCRPLYMLKRMVDLRSDVLLGLHFHSSNKEIITYDKFFNNNIETHIKEAVFLSIELRTYLLKAFGLSARNLLTSLKLDDSWKTLCSEVYTSETFKLFSEVLTRIEKMELSDEKLQFTLDHYGFQMSVVDFQRFIKTTYELNDLDKKEEKENYSYIIVQKRLKQIL